MAEIIISLNPDFCSDRTKEVLQGTIEIAQHMRSEFVTPEHLLYVICGHSEFEKYCQDLGFNLQGMMFELKQYLVSIDTLPEDDPQAIPSLSTAMLLAIRSMQLLGEKEREKKITVSDMLFELADIKDTFASHVLCKYIGDNYDAWTEELYSYYQDDDIKDIGEATDIYSRMMDHAGRLMGALGALGAMGRHSDDEEPVVPPPLPWEQYVTNINSICHRHNRLIGREAELERTMQVLVRKDKNNPLHIGEAGVGKTALIYGLASKIVSGDVPEQLRGMTIFSCDMGELVAGASYHGEMERRVKMVMEGLRERGKSILYIDEIHTIMGSDTGNQTGIANLLKPYLEDGSISFIGSTTYQDYNRHIAKDKSIVRRFQQIEVKEPSVEEALQIVEGLLPYYEAHHGVKYTPEAVREAVEKSAQHMADRFLPDKAIDLIDEAGAYRQLHPLTNKKGERMSAGRQKVTVDVVMDVLAKVCKINAKALTAEDNSSLRTLEQRIGNEIYGQDEAVKQVVKAVKMSKAGLTPADKPLASLLFVGPTGVGKTEVCKVLARELGIELVRFDMSEYTEKHTVAKLIGSPAGYVGYDDGGLLTDAIRRTPNCVLLLDEIEKAHSDIYNILLQVMDYARLTDNKGNKVDFKNVILIMTSNAGAQFATQASIGFGGGQSRGEAMMQTVKKTFKPEFLNRLSGTVVFGDMDKTMAEMILDKKLRELSAMLAAKNVTLSLSDEVRELLLTKGFTLQYGAREMDRVIQNLLTPLLMDEILFDRLMKGGEAKVALDGETLKLV